MKMLKPVLSKLFSVFIGTLLILGLSFALNGNAVVATQSAYATPILSVNFNQDHSSGDYDNVRGIYLRKCLETCGADTRCKAYTFNPKGIQNDGKSVCWLKDKVNPLSDVPPDQRAVTGVVLKR